MTSDMTTDMTSDMMTGMMDACPACCPVSCLFHPLPAWKERKQLVWEETAETAARWTTRSWRDINLVALKEKQTDDLLLCPHFYFMMWFPASASLLWTLQQLAELALAYSYDWYHFHPAALIMTPNDKIITVYWPPPPDGVTVVLCVVSNGNKPRRS